MSKSQKHGTVESCYSYGDGTIVENRGLKMVKWSTLTIFYNFTWFQVFQSRGYVLTFLSSFGLSTSFVTEVFQFWEYGCTFLDWGKYSLVGNFQLIQFFSLFSVFPTLQWIEKINMALRDHRLGRAGNPVEIESFSWHVALNTCLKILNSFVNNQCRKPQAVVSIKHERILFRQDHN